MPNRNAAIVILLSLAAWPAAAGQDRPARMSLDDRLAAIEDRLAAAEDRMARIEESLREPEEPDRLALESEAKLDRLEVRLIQLENAPPGRGLAAGGDRALLERLRALERQVARLRAATTR